MIRVASVLLTALGLLVCPYVCLGKTGSLCVNATHIGGCHQASSCCAAGNGASSQAAGKMPTPCDDDCNHECVVSKGTVETGQKTPREMTQSISDAAFVDFVLPPRLSASTAFETELCKIRFTQRPYSGRPLHVIFAAFLL